MTRLVGILLSGLLCAAVVAQALPEPSPAELALLEASFTGNLDTVRELVSSGVSVETVDADRRTPLMWAGFNGHTEVVRYLLEKGATLEAKDVNGRTALMYASSGPYRETVELLLRKGAKVNVQGKLEGFTALMTAAAEGQAEVVRLLLQYGAEPGLEDKDGDTAEDFALRKGHTTVVDLLQHPPPPTARN